MAEKSNAKERGELFTRIVEDKRVSHGAFRFWHLLNTKFAGKRRACWPGQRKIQKILKCSNDSIKPWSAELVTAGYLRIEKYEKHKHPFVRYSKKPPGLVYFIEDGTVPESRNDSSVPTFDPEAFLKVGTGSVPESRNETNPIGTKSNETKITKNFRSWGDK